MTPDVFLTQLEHCLHGLRTEEKENAISYYREYFEEAGENVNQVIENLGSPQAVAQKILSEMNEVSDKKSTESKTTAQTVILGITLLIVTSPFWAVIAILWLSLLVSLAMILFTLAFSAIAAPIQGISYILNGFIPDGLWDIGSGLLCISLTMLLWKPFFLLAKKVTKDFLAFCQHYLKTLFRKEIAP